MTWTCATSPAAGLKSCHGDLAAKHIAESLEVDKVHGDVDARHLSGDCILDEVNGSLDLQEIAGSIHAACRGTARLRLHDLGGTEYQIQADGNLYCYLPEDASLKIEMFSKGHAIKVRTPRKSTTYQETNRSLVLGDGEVSMSLQSAGSLYLFIERPGWSESDSR